METNLPQWQMTCHTLGLTRDGHFHIALPSNRFHDSPWHGTSLAKPYYMPKTILLVDDEPSLLSALRRLLALEKYDVQTAQTRKEALAHLESQRFDLALLDLNLPDGSGWEIVNQIRSAGKTTPVVVITAQPDQHQHPLTDQIDALMEKPLDLPLLLKTISSLVSPTHHRATPVFCTKAETCMESL